MFEMVGSSSMLMHLSSRALSLNYTVLTPSDYQLYPNITVGAERATFSPPVRVDLTRKSPGPGPQHPSPSHLHTLFIPVPAVLFCARVPNQKSVPE